MAEPSWRRMSTSYGSVPEISFDPNTIPKAHGLNEVFYSSHFGKTLREPVPLYKWAGIGSSTIETIMLPIVSVSLSQAERPIDGNPLCIAEGGAPTTAEAIVIGGRWCMFLPPAFTGIDSVIEIGILGGLDLLGDIAYENSYAIPEDFRRGIVQGALTAGTYVFQPALGPAIPDAMKITLGPGYTSMGMRNTSGAPGPADWTLSYRKFIPHNQPTDPEYHPVDTANAYKVGVDAGETAAGDTLFIYANGGWDPTDETGKIGTALTDDKTKCYFMNRRLSLTAGNTAPVEEWTITTLPHYSVA